MDKLSIFKRFLKAYIKWWWNRWSWQEKDTSDKMPHQNDSSLVSFMILSALYDAERISGLFSIYLAYEQNTNNFAPTWSWSKYTTKLDKCPILQMSNFTSSLFAQSSPSVGITYFFNTNTLFQDPMVQELRLI